jgi:hypothetical protein
MWEIRFNNRIRGPISDGRMARDAEAYSHDVASAIADSAHDTWLNNLHGSIRHETPYYTTQIRKHELAPTRYEISDGGVVYGDWLETGQYTPRRMFDGYHAQLRAEEEVKRKRGNIARRILRRYRSEGKLK